MATVAHDGPAVGPARTYWPEGLVLMATALALILRLPSFGDSLWADEIYTNYVVHGFGVGGSILHILHTDQEGTPPLFFFLAWVTKGLGGPEGLRLPSLLAGLATIPLTYLVGVRTVGRPGALVAAFILALAPFQIFYSTEARAYALVTLCCLLATLCLLRALDGGGWGWWVGYAVSAAATMYSHYTGGFVLLVLFVWAIVTHPEARLRVLAANVGGAVLFGPWVPSFIDQTKGPSAALGAVIHPLTAGNVKTDVVTWIFDHPFIPTRELPGHPAVILGGLGLAIGVVALWLRLRDLPRSAWWPPPDGITLAVSLALAAPVGALLWSLFEPTIFSTRSLATSSPGLALCFGGLVTAGRPPLRYLATALLLVPYAVGGIGMLSKSNQRPDLAGVVSYIDSQGAPNAPIVDIPQPYPGPQTNMEAAFAPDGQAHPSRTILNLDNPTLDTELEARRRGISTLAILPRPSRQQTAAEAARLAGNGKLFITAWGTIPLSVLRSTPGPAADFLAALPRRFHEVAFRTFPGPSVYTESVHVLDGSPPPRPQR